MGDCGANVVVALTGTFLTGYFTDTVGIAAAAVGTMMLIARIFDGITDIIMGAVVDKTNTRWGKARPWVLWSAPFMALALVLIFNVPSSLSDSGKLIYIYITYIFQNCIVYTANNLPYNALLSRMTLNVQDRASTASLRFVMTQLTTLIVNAVTANVLVSIGWFWLSVIYGIICFVMMLICFIGCKEHIDEDNESGVVKVEQVPLNIALPALLKNKYFFDSGSDVLLVVHRCCRNRFNDILFLQHRTRQSGYSDLYLDGNHHPGYYCQPGYAHPRSPVW